MQQIDMISFIDQASGQNGFALVCAGDGTVAVGRSLDKDGDIEPSLTSEVCEQLIRALQRAVQVGKEGER